MVDRNKILSDLSKFAVDAMSTFSGLREEIETLVSLRVDKIIKKMNLVKKDEFDVLKKMVEKLYVQSSLTKTNTNKSKSSMKKKSKNTKIKKKLKKRPKKS